MHERREEPSPIKHEKNYQIYGQSKTSNSISSTLEPISFQEGISFIELARNTCSNSHHHTPNTHDTKQYQQLLLSRKYIQRMQNKEEIFESSTHLISENPEHISMKFGIGSLY